MGSPRSPACRATRRRRSTFKFNSPSAAAEIGLPAACRCQIVSFGPSARKAMSPTNASDRCGCRPGPPHASGLVTAAAQASCSSAAAAAANQTVPLRSLLGSPIRQLGVPLALSATSGGQGACGRAPAGLWDAGGLAGGRPAARRVKMTSAPPLPVRHARDFVAVQGAVGIEAVSVSGWGVGGGRHDGGLQWVAVASRNEPLTERSKLGDPTRTSTARVGALKGTRVLVRDNKQ